MRKQDRIAQEHQNRQQDSSKQDSSKQQPREKEQMRGSASEERPPRQPGAKLPLPE
jgi:hypothetical protein